MRSTILLCLLLLIVPVLSGQGIQSFFLSSGTSDTFPLSNSVVVLETFGDTVWIGTGAGLGMTATAGNAWLNFSSASGTSDNAVSAIAVDDSLLIFSTGYSETRDGNSVAVGAGLFRSTDRGTTWTHIPQPVDSGTVDTLLYGDNRIPALAITVPQQNITYDIALTRGTIWIASFAGMLRKSTDQGGSWERVILPPDNLNSISPEDTLSFDLSPARGNLGLSENLNHRVFSVYSSDDTTLWVGTANGINKSTDGGVRWVKFNHQNQSNPISGNFVVALREQRWGSRRILWAATVNALDPDEQQGVSFSDDGGATWKTTLIGERAHNFAFKDSIVYVATNRGVFRSDDEGKTWRLNGTVFDPVSGQR
ncbi:MAG: hypothetical protein WD295_02045, partial [Bacteroidota bacterium]